MLDRLRLLRYESPITLLAIILVTIFVIGGIIFGAYKIFFDGGALPTVGGNTEIEDVKETTITQDTVRVPSELEGVKFSEEELEAANAAMSDEGAYEGGFENTASPPKEELYMEGAAVDPYVQDSTAGQAVGVHGVKTEAQTKKEIQAAISSTPEESWLGRELTEKESEILKKIKSDPKNCYPEFNSVGNFNNTMQGYDFVFYTEFVMTVLMCGGDIKNYDCGIY